MNTAKETDAVVEGIVTAIDNEFAIVKTGPRVVGCGLCHEPGGLFGLVGGLLLLRAITFGREPVLTLRLKLSASSHSDISCFERKSAT